MKRTAAVAAAFVLAAVVSPIIGADVKTHERALTMFEDVRAAAASPSATAAAKDGVTSTIVVKGDRKASINDVAGTIVDLAEQKVYRLDVRKKEYTVATFDQVREQMARARADAEKHARQIKPPARSKADVADRPMETEFDIRDTGERKTIAGYEAREIVMTVTLHQKDRKVEDSGGFVMTSDLWIGPKVIALEEIEQFDIRYSRAVYGDAPGPDVPQIAQTMASHPMMKQMAERMQAERSKLMGTTLVSTTTFDAIKSAELLKAAPGQKSPATGGRTAGDPPPRTTQVTITRELLSVETSASAADVAIPAGYKEKK